MNQINASQLQVHILNPDASNACHSLIVLSKYSRADVGNVKSGDTFWNVKSVGCREEEGEDGDQRKMQGTDLQKHIDESLLSLWHVHVRPIAEGRHCKSYASLLVSLLTKLDDDSFCPASSEREWSRWIGDVCEMKKHLIEKAAIGPELNIGLRF
jgi:hypothetical protein